MLSQTSRFDLKAALEIVDGDYKILAELAQIFHDCLPDRLQAIETVSADNLPEIARIAHSLKSSLGTFAAERALATVKELETAARQQDVTSAQKLAGSTVERILQLDVELMSTFYNTEQKPVSQS